MDHSTSRRHGVPAVQQRRAIVCGETPQLL